MWDFYPGSAGNFEHDTIIPEDSQWSRSLLKKSEVFRSLSMRINASLLLVRFPSKFRDRDEGTVNYSFYAWFSFLTWVWVNIFLEIVSKKMATTHIFESGMRNWPASVSRCEIEVFNLQAWDSRLRHESWQVYIMLITYYLTVLIVAFIFNADTDLVMSIPQHFELLSFPPSEIEIAGFNWCFYFILIKVIIWSPEVLLEHWQLS